MKVYTRTTASDAWVERPVVRDGVVINDQLNERSDATVQILDTTGTLHFTEGIAVRILDENDTQLFRGFVKKSEETRVGLGGVRTHNLKCVDLHYLADKRLAVGAYTNEQAKAIVQDLIADVLTDEDVIEGVIEDGNLIRSIAFNYVSVAAAMQELAARSGYVWNINNMYGPATFNSDAVTFNGSKVFYDSGFRLNFRERVVAGSPTQTIDVAANAISDSVNVKRDAFTYRNRQWVRGGKDRTDPQTETKVGDGESTSFVLGFPVAEMPSLVEVDRGGGFVQETVGVAGFDDDTDWVFAFNSPTLKQNEGGTVLTSTDRLRITYKGLFDVITRVDDAPAQAARAASEGNSGIVEHVLYDKSVSNSDEAIQLAGQLTDYYASNVTDVRFTTRSVTVEPGDIVSVVFTEGGVETEQAVVTTVSNFLREGTRFTTLDLVIGPVEGSWAEWFSALNRKADRALDVSGETKETVTTVESFSKTWGAGDAPNIFTEAKVGTAVVGTARPSFVPEQRVSYLAWFYDGVELGRKFRTTQTGANTDDIETTVILVNADAVGDIDEFAWFGGREASSALGSGIEVGREAFVKTKTDLEQIQVVRTDENGSA